MKRKITLSIFGHSSLVLGVSLFASVVHASPVVTGTTISWPDDGWYQVQTADGSATLCNGGRSCDVSPGAYLVINHSTGQRFRDITVSGSTTPAPSGVTVSGSTISWPDDGWYQVQTADGSTTICSGGSSCEVSAGSYVVINHSTGERFEDVVVGDAVEGTPPSGVDGVTVDGTTISWPDDGWYQVQNAETFVAVCQGGLSCEVTPGTYFVINHTTGVRETVSVEAAGGGTPPVDIAAVEVNFDITVPFLVSNALQVQLISGDTRLTAAWLVDESWTVTGEFPANADNPISVFFFDDNGAVTLATAETSFRTDAAEVQEYQVTADQFNFERFDDDGDGISNLEELRAGRNPFIADITDPTGPTQVSALSITTYSGFDLELFWPNATDDVVVLGYDIYRNGELLASTLDALSFYDASVEPESEYVYTIYAVDNDGFRSLPTSTTVTTPADVPLTGVAAQFASISGGEGDLADWIISDGLTTTNGEQAGGGCSTRGGAGSGVGIRDASLINADGSRQADAFDNASLIWINGEQVGGFLRAATETTSNYASVPLSGLDVSVEYHAVSASTTLRNLTTLRNDTGSDIVAIVNFVSNFGSDSGTRIYTTSSSDASLGTDDRWVITDDSSTEAGDPANTTVFYGPGSPRSDVEFTQQTVFNCASSNGINARLDVVIPAGSQRSVLFFHQISRSSANADFAALQFDTTPAPSSALVEGLSAEQLSEIVNWDF